MHSELSFGIMTTQCHQQCLDEIYYKVSEALFYHRDNTQSREKFRTNIYSVSAFSKVIETHIGFLKNYKQLHIPESLLCTSCREYYNQIVSSSVYTFLFNRIIANDNYVHLTHELNRMNPSFSEKIKILLHHKSFKIPMCSYWIGVEYYHKKIYISKTTMV